MRGKVQQYRRILNQLRLIHSSRRALAYIFPYSGEKTGVL